MAIKDSANEAEESRGGTDIPLIEIRRSNGSISTNDSQRLSEYFQPIQGVVESHSKTKNHQIYGLYLRVFKYIKRNYLLIMPCLSIIIYLYDVFSDFYTAAIHFVYKNYWYFGLTLTFIIAPGIIICFHDIYWYITDHRKGNVLTKWRKVLIGVLICLHIAPILRYFYLFQHEVEIREQRRDKEELDKEHRERNAKKDYDSSFLKLLESYFESAPQLVLQISILLQDFKSPFTNARACLQVISIIGSLLSLSMSMVFLQQFKQESLRGENFSLLQKILRAATQFLLVTSRIIAMSLLATVCPYRLLGILAAHWILMVVLIFQIGIEVENKNSIRILRQFGEYGELAVILIFSFISIKKGNNIRNAVVYYSVILCENIIMMVWWNNHRDPDTWYYMIGLILHFALFFSGILCLIIINCYYEVRRWANLISEQVENA